MRLTEVLLSSILMAFLLEMQILALQKCRKLHFRNGKMTINRNGINAKYKCKRGYTMVGKVSSVCLATGWSPPAPQCIASDTTTTRPSASTTTFAAPKRKSSPIAADTSTQMVTVSPTPLATTSVIRKGTASTAGTKTGCRTINIANGKAEWKGRGKKKVKFSCNDGYKMVGSVKPFAKCQNGRWNRKAPRCIFSESITTAADTSTQMVTVSPTPLATTSVIRKGTASTAGTKTGCRTINIANGKAEWKGRGKKKVKFSCNDGYKMVGSVKPFAKCQNGRWNRKAPRCIFSESITIAVDTSTQMVMVSPTPLATTSVIRIGTASTAVTPSAKPKTTTTFINVPDTGPTNTMTTATGLKIAIKVNSVKIPGMDSRTTSSKAILPPVTKATTPQSETSQMTVSSTSPVSTTRMAEPRTAVVADITTIPKTASRKPQRPTVTSSSFIITGKPTTVKSVEETTIIIPYASATTITSESKTSKGRSTAAVTKSDSPTTKSTKAKPVEQSTSFFPFASISKITDDAETTKETSPATITRSGRPLATSVKTMKEVTKMDASTTTVRSVVASSLVMGESSKASPKGYTTDNSAYGTVTQAKGTLTEQHSDVSTRPDHTTYPAVTDVMRTSTNRNPISHNANTTHVTTEHTETSTRQADNVITPPDTNVLIPGTVVNEVPMAIPVNVPLPGIKSNERNTASPASVPFPGISDEDLHPVSPDKVDGISSGKSTAMFPDFKPIPVDSLTDSSSASIMPEVVAITAGFVVGVMVIGVVAWLWERSRRKTAESEARDEEMGMQPEGDPAVSGDSIK